MWEQWNKDVHGKAETQQQFRPLKRLKIEIQELHNLRDQIRPSDNFIFHDDLGGFLENATATRAANYISSTKEIILHSVAAAAKAAVTKTKNILECFKPVDPAGLKWIQQWKRNNLVNDAFSKKKKRKLKMKNTVEPIRFIDNRNLQDVYRFGRTSHTQ